MSFGDGPIEKGNCRWLKIAIERLEDTTAAKVEIDISRNHIVNKCFQVSKEGVATWDEDWDGRNIGFMTETEIVHRARRKIVGLAQEMGWRLTQDNAYSVIFER